jgi:hypothetical protein
MQTARSSLPMYPAQQRILTPLKSPLTVLATTVKRSIHHQISMTRGLSLSKLALSKPTISALSQKEASVLL